jgi:hypothetical protein
MAQEGGGNQRQHERHDTTLLLPRQGDTFGNVQPGSYQGEPYQFFKRGVFGRDGASKVTSLSEAEQERFATAIKTDLSAIHHGRLTVSMRELQALRLLVVAHRMGYNTTPLLELTRDAVRPGLLPGTVLLQTVKHRSKRIGTQVCRGDDSGPECLGPTNSIGESSSDSPRATASEGTVPADFPERRFLPFTLTESAVISQAITSTQHLVARAPNRLKNRVWLYEISQSGAHSRKGDVSSMAACTLFVSIKALVKRHALFGDDGRPMTVSTSRFRKSLFDRAFRISDGDLALTANLMGNTPNVAGMNYPSMSHARQVDAAGFMNDDYVALMRDPDHRQAQPLALPPEPLGTSTRIAAVTRLCQVSTPTPVAGCSDTLGGEHAPKNGSPCDRFVRCLFCSSFAIVGTVDELWRLFSFQAFAQAELDYLDERLGLESAVAERPDYLEELRSRYRLAVPYIDSLSNRQFAGSRVAQARARTATRLHPFWQAQMAHSRRARDSGLEGVGIPDGKNAATP